MGRAEREAPLGADPAARALRPGPAEGPGGAARAAARAGLYVHVPFCAARCAYCDFASGIVSAAAIERWLAGIEREAALRAPQAAALEFSSVFLGGGTPSVLDPAHARRLFRALRGSFTVAAGAEVTLEANPESVTAERLECWRACGVNRLSVGAQSFSAPELARLGRLHGAGDPGRVFAEARAHGFARLSLDLMYGFPGQSLESWDGTLESALALEPEHLSAYAFTAEPGTRLGEAVRAGRERTMGDDEQAEAYGRFVERAAESGLGLYETSNVCRPDAEARHNLVYWLCRPYAGLGPSAHGLLDGERYGNERDLGRWADALERGTAPEVLREPADPAARAREVLLLGLRLAGGVRERDYAADLWAAVRSHYGTALGEAVRTGRLEARAEGFAVPRALRFVADDVLAWIEARAEAHGGARADAGIGARRRARRRAR